MENEKKYAVIILAAGLSSRMGEFKPLLEIGNVSSLKRLIRSAKDSNLNDIIVVTGNKSNLTETVANEEKVISTYNKFYKEGMFTSIKAGVEIIGKEIEAFFVLPVDYPLVPAQVFLDLIDKYENCPNSIIIPCYMGKKGHPPLLPASLIPEILESTGENGLKSIMMKHDSMILNMDSAFREVVMSMNTQSDYMEMVSYFNEKQI